MTVPIFSLEPIKLIIAKKHFFGLGFRSTK